jgi:hypothetical protein
MIPELRDRFKLPEAEIETESPEATGVDRGIDGLILRIRPMFGRSDMLTKEEVASKLWEVLGYASDEDKGDEEVEDVVRAAVQRSILQKEDGGYALVSRTISEYPREILKEQFLASLNGNGWIERSEAIPRFARWLGFRRTGPNIEDSARSVINGLIRADRLEKMGSKIRRRG